jgi:hypothetical protein
MSNMNLNIVSTFKGDGIKQATSQLGAFSGKMGGLGSVLGKVGGALAAFGVTAKAIEFSRNSITAARDLERNLYGVETIFGDLAPRMIEFTKNAEEMGLSQSKAAKATTFIGSVLKQSGFAMSDVAVETEKLVGLATDLSILYGYDVQEALLGMTALFRGEYDPIEKFGVAMKQQEINSELAARGLGNLEGAALRNAEQTVRMELLYERASDAMGTFAGQTGTLFTEQKKLGATFENFQATLGAAVIPAMAELNTVFRELLVDITPGMQQAFGFLAEILTGVLGLIKDAVDPTTNIGESVAALSIQFESLFKTIFGQDATIADVFELAGAALGMFIDFMHDLLRIVENTIIGFQVMGEQIGLLLSGQFQEFLNFDAAGEIRKRIDLKDTINDNKLAVKQYIAEWDKARELELSGHITGINRTADAWERANRAASLYSRPKGLPGSADAIERWLNVVAPKTKAISTDIGSITSATSGSSASAAPKGPTGIDAWLANAEKDAAVARARLQLIGMGLSEAVADSITSGSDGLLSANQALGLLASNTAGYVAHFTRLFNQSAEGQRLAAKQAEEAAELAIKLSKETSEEARRAAEEAFKAAKELSDQEKAIFDQRQRAMESFADSVKSIFGGIKDSIMSAFTLPNLGNSVNSITRNIKKLLERTKAFARNITSLSQQGLSNELLQQVIAAGPMAGGRLAEALVGAGGGTIGELNQAYGEFGSIASDIAGVGTRSQFANAQVVNTYNIEVNGGVGSGPTIGRAIVDAIKSYERTSGAVWQGAA